MEGGGGHFTKNEVSLNYNAFVEHGENVDVVCHTGYFPKGPPRLRCWYGEWSGGVDSVTDFLIELGMKPRMHLEISIFSLNNVMVRPTKIMNRADKNWAHFWKII